MIDSTEATLGTMIDRMSATRTLLEIESLIQPVISQVLNLTSVKDPCLRSLLKAENRILFLLLHQCGTHLSTSEWFQVHSRHSIVQRYLRENP